MQWGIHHHPAAWKCQQKRDTITPCQVWYQSWRQHVTPLCVLMPLPRSDQPSWPIHWPWSRQYQTHCLQWIPYTSIWCTLWAHHLATRPPWLSTLQGKIIWVHHRHPWSCHPWSTLKWKTCCCEDELCHHSQVTWHTSCTCSHYNGHNQACYSPWSSQAHQVHWWLDQQVSRSVQGYWQIPWQIQDLTLSWCTSHDTDNITVHGHTEVEHDAHLRDLMCITCKYNLVFNPQKTHVKAQAVNFFGCLYDANGVHPDLCKVEAVHALPAPTNITEL